MVNQTISPAQLAQELQTDPDAVVLFLLQNNFDAVADNLQGAGFNRPSSIELAWKQLQALLNSGQGNDWVNCLSVPINGQQLSPELMATVLTVGQQMGGSTGFIKSGQPIGVNDIARGLATGALAMLNARGTANDTATGTGGTSTTTNNTGTPDADAEQRRKVWRMVGWGLLATAVIVGLALGIRALSKK